MEIMADNIIENYNINTMEHDMKTQGCHLKEIKKMILLDNDNSDKNFICVHFRSIEDDQHRVRSFKATEDFLNGCFTRTEETKVILNRTVTFEETEMTSGEIVEFEEDWKKLWHPKMTQGELANGARRKHSL